MYMYFTANEGIMNTKDITFSHCTIYMDQLISLNYVGFLSLATSVKFINLIVIDTFINPGLPVE